MKRVVFIGQAPARPTSKHGVAGTYLRPWLYELGLDEQTIVRHCRFYALIDSFPGSDTHGHLRPTPEQIVRHRPLLLNLIKEFMPDIIVPVGAMAIKEVLPNVAGGLQNTVGHTYYVDLFGGFGKEILVIPLPHPSGRSVWINTNRDKVAKALLLLKDNIT
jgi:uracil-DNA glycosylase